MRKNWKVALTIIGISMLACFVPVHGSSIVTAAYGLIESAGTPVTQRSILNFVSGTTCVDNSGLNRTDCTTTGAGPSANQNIRSFGGGFDGGGTALTSGATTYVTVPFACTIAAWNITVDTGTITFDIWKIATGTAIPTIANTITASALPALSTGTAIHSTTLTGWTTAVSANDIVGVEINAVASATKASLVVQCNATS